MSVHKSRVGSWETRWRDPATGRNRSKSFKTKRDADAFDKTMAQIKDAAKTKALIEQARKAAGLDDPDAVAAERGQRPHYDNDGYEIR